MTSWSLISRSPRETERLGLHLGKLLEPGMMVALHGDLGGGKTYFVRGIVAGAAPESAHLVSSPTFAIMNEYPGSLPVYHFDFYRLAGPGDIIELGFEEYLHGRGVCLTEWPDRLGSLMPDEHLQVLFERYGDEQRRITIEAHGKRYRDIQEQLKTTYNSANFL